MLKTREDDGGNGYKRQQQEEEDDEEKAEEDSLDSEPHEQVVSLVSPFTNLSAVLQTDAGCCTNTHTQTDSSPDQSLWSLLS